MRRDGIEVAKGRMKFKCPKISHTSGCISCTCENPCSNVKYGRTVHLVLKDNLRLFNSPPRSSKEWKLEYNARTSAERSNKREKLDFKLEDDRHRSNVKYGRTVHLVLKDNLRLFNSPPRSSKEWKLEYNARTSAERSNKREKLDFKLEDDRHRSTKMWYCRLYHILMLQHLDAWDLPSEVTPQKLILDVA